MNETIPAHPKSGRRFVRWTLIALAWLVTLIVLFYAEENWRGARAAESFKRRAIAAGTQLDPAALVPQPVPDEQNFAMTPFFAPLYDFQPGTQKPRDAVGSERVKNFASEFTPEQFYTGP